jgi:hypothetical protein
MLRRFSRAGQRRWQGHDDQGHRGWGQATSLLPLPPVVLGALSHVLSHLRPAFAPPVAARQRAQRHHGIDMRAGLVHACSFHASLHHQLIGALHASTADGITPSVTPGNRPACSTASPTRNIGELFRVHDPRSLLPHRRAHRPNRHRLDPRPLVVQECEHGPIHAEQLHPWACRSWGQLPLDGLHCGRLYRSVRHRTPAFGHPPHSGRRDGHPGKEGNLSAASAKGIQVPRRIRLSCGRGVNGPGSNANFSSRREKPGLAGWTPRITPPQAQRFPCCVVTCRSCGPRGSSRVPQ